jgi:hypothetical protein
MLLSSSALQAQDQRVEALSASVAAAYALIAPDVAGEAVRTDIRHERGAVVLRVTRANPAVELSRQARPAAPAMEARITQALTGELLSIAVSGAVVDRSPVRVVETATDGAKEQALRRARYGADASTAMLTMAQQRVATMAPDAAPSEARLVWQQTGTDLEARWQVRITMTTVAGPRTYRATFSAADGSLTALEQEGRR